MFDGVPMNFPISFIVPCKGRYVDVLKTAPEILKREIEYILVDYSCPMNCSKWIATKYPTVKSLLVPNQNYFNASKARNAGFSIAQQKWLCFISADMMLSNDFFFQLNDLQEGTFIVFDSYSPGYIGTIICENNAFKKAGGYCEDYYGYIFQHLDLRCRLNAIGLKETRISKNLATHIDHDDGIRFLNYEAEQIEVKKHDCNLFFKMKIKDIVIPCPTGFGDIWRRVNEAKEISVLNDTIIGIERTSYGHVAQGVIDSLVDSPGKVSLVEKKATRSPYNSPISYFPTTKKWIPEKHGKICYQFNGKHEGSLDLEIQKELLSSFPGYEMIKLGLPLTIQENIEIAATSDLFIGVNSGMSHLVRSVGTPAIITNKNIASINDWHKDGFLAVSPSSSQVIIEIAMEILTGKTIFEHSSRWKGQNIPKQTKNFSLHPNSGFGDIIRAIQTASVYAEQHPSERVGINPLLGGRDAASTVLELLDSLELQQPVSLSYEKGEFDSALISYVKTKNKWKPGKYERICYQFDGGSHGSPSRASIDFFTKSFSGVTLVHIGKHFSIEHNINLLSKSDFFVGVDSGMLHLARSVGIPCFVVPGIKRSIEFVKQWHLENSGYELCTSMDDMVYKGLKILNTGISIDSQSLITIIGSPPWIGNIKFGDTWRMVNEALSKSISGKPIGINTTGTKSSTLFQEVIEALGCQGKVFITQKPATSTIDSRPISYFPTMKKWTFGPYHRICYQFDGICKGGLPEGMEKQLLSSFPNYEMIRLGGHLRVQENVEIATTSDLFIGVNSGMAHLARSVGIPTLIIGDDQNSIYEWHRDGFIPATPNFEEILKKSKFLIGCKAEIRKPDMWYFPNQPTHKPLKIIYAVLATWKQPEHLSEILCTWAKDIKQDERLIIIGDDILAKNYPNLEVLECVKANSINDNYEKLTIKMFDFYRRLKDDPNWDILVKTDTDTLLIPDRLRTFLQKEYNPFLYIGQIATNDKGTTYCEGGCYILSKQALELAWEDIKTNLVNDPCGGEDWRLALGLLHQGIKPRHSPLICQYDNLNGILYGGLISSHWLKEGKLSKYYIHLKNKTEKHEIEGVYKVQHCEWQGEINLIKGGTFTSKGPSNPNGTWVRKNNDIILNWYHWKPEQVTIVENGFCSQKMIATWYGPMSDKEIFIFGLRRSGNHAIIHWIVGLFQDRYQNIREDCINNKFFINNQPLPLPYAVPQTLPFNNIQIISFESQRAIIDNESLIDPTKRKGTIKKPIVVHRDPFNWMASTRALRGLWENEEEFERLVDLWIAYTKKFFIEKPDLAHTIKFNDWRNIECRKRLAQYIGEPFSDVGLNWIKGPVQGGPGSSFTYDKYDGKAQEMDLEGRWRTLDDTCKKFFDKKPELRIFSKQIFDFCPF